MIPITDNNWALSVAVFLPLAGIAVMLFIPRAEEQLHKLVALVTAVATAGVGVYLLVAFDYDRAGDLQFFVDKPWIDVIHSRYILGLDGISLPLVALTMGITVLCIIYSLDHIPHPGNAKAFLILILLLEVGMVGTFVAQDLILFFVFFEVVLLPMYFMIGVWGGEQRQYASIKFFLFTLFGSALMLLSFLALFFKTGAETFSIVALPDLVAASGISSGVAALIFAGMFMGFAIKVPMFPFHTWLPDAHTQAPTVGSVILAAILLKLGTYGFIRVAIPILPDAAEDWAPWIGLLAVIGIIYGALVLPGPDRHEAPHRLLLGVAHGLRDARHRHADALRAERGGLRHGGPRPHHRHPVLRGRLGEGALPHPRDPAHGRHAEADPPPRLDPRLRGDGVARPARAWRASGVSSPPSCRPTTPRPRCRRRRSAPSW